MTVVAYLSGGAANSDQAASLGGVKSSTLAPPEVFGNIPVADFTAGSFRYRCVYPQTDVAQGDLKVWVEAETPSPDTTVWIAWAAAGVNATEPAIANETTPPPGVTFSNPRSEAAALNGGDFPAGGWRGLWIRYSISPTSAKLMETFALGFKGTDNNQVFLDGEEVQLDDENVELA